MPEKLAEKLALGSASSRPEPKTDNCIWSQLFIPTQMNMLLLPPRTQMNMLLLPPRRLPKENLQDAKKWSRCV
jgi:hypothetical protein